MQFPLAPLTLLANVNASGKSSVLRALVLLHQTMREREWTTRLAHNGAYARSCSPAARSRSRHARRATHSWGMPFRP